MSIVIRYAALAVALTTAILVSIPVVALFFALQKQLVGGLTAGGVKG